MPQKVVHGFAWLAFPDVFAAADPDAPPGHPFASSTGEVRPPEEVLYFRPARPNDTGVRGEHRDHMYLVVSKTQFHPRLSGGWDSEPASLAENFKTADGKVRLAKVCQVHHRHAGDLMECEFKIEEG